MAVNRVSINDPKAVGTPADKPAAKAVDPEFKAFSDKVNARAGKTLSPERLNGLWAIQQAKTAKSSALSKTKSEFEAKQDTETLSVSSKSGEVGLNKATGTMGASAVTGLTPEQVTQVSSILSAGPVLPPAGSDPIDAEGASGVLDLVLVNLEVDGAPFDKKAYSTSIVGADSSDIPALAAKSTSAQPKTIAQVTMPGNAKVGMGAVPTKSAGASAMGIGPTADAPSLSFNSRSAALNKANKKELLNTGGLKSTYWESSKPRFNWDYFTIKFAITSQKDLNGWKKFMKEMQQADRDFSIQTTKFRIAYKQMKDKFEKLNTVSDFASAVHGAKSAYESLKAQDAMGPPKDEATANKQKESDKNLKDSADVFMPKGSGRTYLSESELTSLESDKSKPLNPSQKEAIGNYRNIMADRKELEGPAGYRSMMLKELGGLGDGDSGAAKSIQKDIDVATADQEKQIGELGKGGMDQLRPLLSAKMATIKDAEAKIAKTEAALKESPNSNKEEQAKAVAANEVAKKDLTREKADTFLTLQAFNKAEGFVPKKGEKGPPKDNDLTSKQLISGGKDLDAAFAKEKAYNDGPRAARRTDPNGGKTFKKMASAVTGFTDQLNSGGSPYGDAINRSIQKTQAMARKNSHQLNSVIAQGEAATQGMINQLMSLLAMSRR